MFRQTDSVASIKSEHGAPRKRLNDLRMVQSFIPIGKTGIYDAMNRGLLAKPIKVGRRSFWTNEDIEKAIVNLEASRAA